MLRALANPGSHCQITALVEAPQLSPACAAACLTLLDLETQLWLQPTFAEDVKTWLLFHTGCLLTSAQTANFAIINDCASMPALSAFNQGSDQEPEAATTLLVQVENLETGESIRITGPGIDGINSLSVGGLSAAFWQDLVNNVRSYPKGIDIFLFTRDTVVGLPRTTKIVIN